MKEPSLREFSCFLRRLGLQTDPAVITGLLQLAEIVDEKQCRLFFELLHQTITSKKHPPLTYPLLLRHAAYVLDIDYEAVLPATTQEILPGTPISALTAQERLYADTMILMNRLQELGRNYGEETIRTMLSCFTSLLVQE